MDGMDITTERHQSSICFTAFDTNVRLTVYGSDKVCQPLLLQAKRMCLEYERLFSATIPSSDVARVNRAKGSRTRVDERTATLVKEALRYCETSEGTFDITIGSVSRLWDLKRGIVPAPDELAKAVQHVDWQYVETSSEEGYAYVQLADPDAMIDLGGIAKGWIADELGTLFACEGAEGYVIDLGGNILVGGSKPDESPWNIELPPHMSCHGMRRSVPITQGSVVTSGTYERACTVDGILYHHILDPHTGWPIAVPCPCVSVFCERSLDAEGFSTTLLALGPERALSFKRAHPEILQIWFAPLS